MTSSSDRPTVRAVYKRLARGGAWSLLGSVGASGLNLLVGLVVARLVGREIYGQYVLVQTSVVAIGIVAGVGLGTAATRYVAGSRADSGRLSRLLTLNQLVLVTNANEAAEQTTLCAQWIAGVIGINELRWPIAVAAWSIPLLAIDGFQKGVLIGFEAMPAFALASIGGALCALPIMLWSAELGLLALSGGFLASAAIQAFVSFVAVSNRLRHEGVSRFVTRGILDEVNSLTEYFWPSLIAAVAVSPVHWVAQVLLARRDSSAAEVALLGIATQWLTVVTFAPSVAGRIVLPVLTERVVAGQRSEAASVLKAALLATLLACVPVAAAVLFASRSVASWYGPGFEGASVAIRWAAFAGALAVLANPIGQLLAATNRMWLGAAMNLGWATVYLGGIVAGLGTYGASGVMSSMAIAYAAHLIWVGAYARTYFKGMEVSR